MKFIYSTTNLQKIQQNKNMLNDIMGKNTRNSRLWENLQAKYGLLNKYIVKK